MKQLTLAVLALLTAALVTASAETIFHQRALEFRGGANIYMMMDDPSDFVNQFPGSSLNSEMNFAPNFGISLLYKSRYNFVWNIGYNHLFSDKTEFSLPGSTNEEVVDANEIFIIPSFIFFPNSRLNFSVGAGLDIMMATVDRTTSIPNNNLKEFYGATGKNVGFVALGNAEFLLTPNWGINGGLGFRAVNVDDINFSSYEGDVEQSNQVTWVTSSGQVTTRAYELDFTGIFAELGVRWYFDPLK